MLMSILERIVVHPYSKSVEEFITKFREFLTTSEKSHELQIVSHILYYFHFNKLRLERKINHEFKDIQLKIQTYSKIQTCCLC